jgi:DUF438 domain-containing protein
MHWHRSKVRADWRDIMNNSAAIGYVIMAAKNLDMDKETIKQLESEMKYCMDMKDEEQAEKVYQEF